MGKYSGGSVGAGLGGWGGAGPGGTSGSYSSGTTYSGSGYSGTTGSSGGGSSTSGGGGGGRGSAVPKDKQGNPMTYDVVKGWQSTSVQPYSVNATSLAAMTPQARKEQGYTDTARINATLQQGLNQGNLTQTSYNAYKQRSGEWKLTGQSSTGTPIYENQQTGERRAYESRTFEQIQKEKEISQFQQKFYSNIIAKQEAYKKQQATTDMINKPVRELTAADKFALAAKNIPGQTTISNKGMEQPKGLNFGTPSGMISIAGEKTELKPTPAPIIPAEAMLPLLPQSSTCPAFTSKNFCTGLSFFNCSSL